MASIRIPTYERQVEAQPALSETPKLDTSGSSPEAFGVGAAEAGKKYAQAESGLGETLAKGADVVAGGVNKIAEEKYKQEEQQVVGADTQARMNMRAGLVNPDLDKETGKPKGLLNRKLEQANGVTAEFDQNYTKLREDALNSLPAMHQKRALANRLDEHYNQQRDFVQDYEADQKRGAFASSLEGNVRQRVSDAALIRDPKQLQNAVDEVTFFAFNGFKRMGLPDDAAMAKAKEAGSDLVKSSVINELESNPGVAKQKLEATQNMIMPDRAAELRQTINGKFQDVKINQLWSDLEGDPKYKLSDGTYNKQALTDYAAQNSGSVGEQTAMTREFLGRANADDAALDDQHKAQVSAFNNDLAKGFSNGVPREAAMKSLFGAKHYGWDETSRAKMQDNLDKLYSGNRGPFVEEAAKGWNDEQKLAWVDIKGEIETKWKGVAKTLPGDTMETKMAPHMEAVLQERFVMGNMNATQMRQEAAKFLQGETTTKKRSWLPDATASNWQIGEVQSRLNRQEVDALRNNPRYGGEVDDAIATIRRMGKGEPTAKAIQLWIDGHR